MSQDLHTATAAHEKFQINVLLYEGAEHVWVAQGLEKNLVAHGPTPAAALANIKTVLQLRVNFDCLHKRDPLGRLQPARDIYWAAKQHATLFHSDEDATSVLLPIHVRAFKTDCPIAATPA